MSVPMAFDGSVPENYARYLEPVIFRPWAERLADLAGLREGQTVLDVAAGTGVVARVAADRVGATGRVIATDISADMLAHVIPPYTGTTPMEVRACPAGALTVSDESADVVLCQQGLQFMPDRAAASREMWRALRPGGCLTLAVWERSPRVLPFIIFGEALAAAGVPEPFEGAYNSTAISMTTDEVREALTDGGFDDIEVLEVESQVLSWPSVDSAANGIWGTPYGRVLAGLAPSQQTAVMEDLTERMTAAGGGPEAHVTISVLARARC